MKKVYFATLSLAFSLVIAGCGSDSSQSATPTVSSEAKKENAPEKAKGKQVTKANMPSMKYVD